MAISIILKNAAVQLWGPEQIKFPSPFGDAVLRVGPAGIFPQELFIIVAAIGTVLLVQVFLKRAVLGKALTAVAFNRNAAAVMGINVQRMIVLAFVLSSALAGLGGILIAPITFAWAYMGTVPGIKAFAAAIFGGLENPIGILVGGLRRLVNVYVDGRDARAELLEVPHDLGPERVAVVREVLRDVARAVEAWRFTDLSGFDPDTFSANGAKEIAKPPQMLDIAVEPGARLEFMSGIDVHHTMVRFLWRLVRGDGTRGDTSITIGVGRRFLGLRVGSGITRSPSSASAAPRRKPKTSDAASPAHSAAASPRPRSRSGSRRARRPGPTPGSRGRRSTPRGSAAPDRDGRAVLRCGGHSVSVPTYSIGE